MAKFMCGGCRLPLPTKEARCRSCGWAIDYDSATTRRARAMAVGVGVLIAVIAASVFAVAYVELHP